MLIKNSPKRNFEKGFSLLEILISIAFFLLLAVGGTSAFGPWTKFKRIYDTDARLSILKKATVDMYKMSAWYIDSAELGPDLGAYSTHTHSIPYLDMGRTLQENANGLDVMCDPTDNDEHEPWIIQRLAGFLGYTGRNASAILYDGHNRPFCFFVSERLSRKVNGTTIFYHNFGFLSKGENGKTEMLWDQATGTFSQDLTATSDQDDRFFVVSGWDIEYDNYQLLLTRIDRIARAYSIYFTSRYKMDPSAFSVNNYFLKDGCATHVGGICPNVEIVRFSVPTPINSSNTDMATFMDETGVLSADTLTPWVMHNAELTTSATYLGARNILLQNACPNNTYAPGDPASTSVTDTCEIRSKPQTGSNSASNVPPPYSIIVEGVLPGAERIATTTMGIY